MSSLSQPSVPRENPSREHLSHENMPVENASFPKAGGNQRVVKIGSWERDLATGRIYWSADARAIVGFEEHEVWTIEEYIAHIVHPHDRERVQEAIRYGIEQGTGYEIEYRILVSPSRSAHAYSRKHLSRQGSIEKTVLVSCIMSESLSGVEHEFEAREDGAHKRLHGTIQDISALRATASELDTQRFLLRESQAIAKIGGWEYDLASGNLFWTDEYYHLIRRTPEEYPATIDNYYALVHPHDRKRVYDDMQAALQGKSDALEYRIVLPDDTVRHIRGYGAVVRSGADERIVKLRGVIQDITDNKRSEQKLKRLTDILNQAQHLTQLGSWERDLRTDELTWSDEFFRQLGYEAQQFQPEAGYFLTHVHPDDRHIVKEAISALVRNDFSSIPESRFIEYRLIRSDGTTRYMRGTGGNIVNSRGEVTVIFGTLQDITYLQEAQQRLEASERKFRQLFEQSTLGKLIFTSALQPLQANTALLELLGYSAEELLTTPHQNLFHEDERHRFTEHLQALLLGNIPLIHTDVRLRTKAGSTIWCRVQVSIFEQHNDTIERNILMTAEDITQYRQVEAAIQKTLQRERETFDQRNQIIARLTQQLQTPLSTISLASNIMHKHHFKMPEEKISSYFGSISEAIEEIQSLMSNMVLMGKLETGRAQLQLAPLNFTSYSKRLLSEFTSKYSHRPVEATFNLPENTPALIDHELLRLIVWHLLLFLDKGLAKGLPIQCAIEVVFASGTQLASSIEWYFSCTDSRYDDIAALLQDSEHATSDASEVGLATIQQAVQLHGAHLRGKNSGTMLKLALQLPLPS